MDWISVKDRLPEERVRVLTIDSRFPESVEYRIDYIILFEDPKEPYIWARRLVDEYDKVTHWIPLPEPPKE